MNTNVEKAVKKQMYFLQRQSKAMSFTAIAPSDYEHSTGPIDLTKIYVQQDVISYTVKHSNRHQLAPINLRERAETPILPTIISDYNQFVFLLGEAGSGKTCFLNYFCHALCDYYLNGNTLEGVDLSKFSDMPVVCFALKEYVSVAVLDRANPSSFLWCMIRASLVNNIENTDADLLYEYIYNDNKFILILDGFDEISDEAKEMTINALNKLTLNKNVYIFVSSRTYIYSQFENRFCTKNAYSLATFNEPQIREFIGLWYANVACVGDNCQNDLSNKLISEIKDKPYLMEMASKPLLLTLMLMIHINHGGLPQNRITLFDESISLLLKRWENSKKNDTSTRYDNEDITELRLTTDTILITLEEISYKAILSNTCNTHILDKIDADESIFVTPFSRVLPDEINPRKVLEYLANITNLIAPSENHKYYFTIRSLQEYLAACYICKELDHTAKINELLESAPNLWREVCILSICKIGINQPSNAIATINMLLTSHHKNKTAYRRSKEGIIALLQAYSELEDNVRECFVHVKQNVQKWLEYIFKSKDTLPYERLISGDIINQIGDHRKGITSAIHGDVIYPDIAWISISAGDFILGSEESSYNKQQNFFLKQFYISKYPITNAQYEVFIKDGGYECEELWSVEGWKWLNDNGYDYFSTNKIIYTPEERKKQYEEWINSRKGNAKKIPYWWRDYPWNYDNRPVVGITWYEADAYCNWLNTRLNCYGALRYSTDEYIIRLPTSAEWEKAIYIPNAIYYPWGDTFDENCVNTSESEIGQTCAVGLFESLSCANGVSDMIGNVYEWVSTGVVLEDETGFVDKYAIDFRENKEAHLIRIVRGSSWNFDKEAAKRYYINWDYPMIFDQNTGFRVVYAPPIIIN